MAVKDPKLAGDGKCYVCPRERPAKAKADGDPFCSTECAKAWHSRLARRLGLFAKPRVIVDESDREVTLTERELVWLIDTVGPMVAGKRARP